MTGQWLFADDRLSGACRRQHMLFVNMGRGADIDNINAGEQLVDLRNRLIEDDEPGSLTASVNRLKKPRIRYSRQLAMASANASITASCGCSTSSNGYANCPWRRSLKAAGGMIRSAMNEGKSSPINVRISPRMKPESAPRPPGQRASEHSRHFGHGHAARAQPGVRLRFAVRSRPAAAHDGHCETQFLPTRRRVVM